MTTLETNAFVQSQGVAFVEAKLRKRMSGSFKKG